MLITRDVWTFHVSSPRVGMVSAGIAKRIKSFGKSARCHSGLNQKIKNQITILLINFGTHINQNRINRFGFGTVAILALLSGLGVNT